MIKISVIIPVYNTGRYLKRCLDSVLNQSLDEIEIICIDDGSEDDSMKILEEYRHLNNFKIIEHTNSGPSVSRNAGIEAASGEYIAFLDSDDFVDSNFYKELYENIIKSNADIACASILRENNKKKTLLIKYDKTETAQNIKDKFKLAGCPKYNFVWNKLYKKAFIEENHLSFIPGVIYEDMWFTPDALEAAASVISVPNTVYHYWKHKNSLIKRNTDSSRADKINAEKYLHSKCELYGINYTNPIYKEDYIFGGILFLRKKIYKATKRYYLFGIIPFLETRKTV